MSNKKLKWIHGAIPALLVHSNIGSVYCWSLLSGPLSESLGGVSVSMAFSLAIFFLGMSAAFGGRFVEKRVKLSTLVSAISYGLGLLVAGLGITTGSEVLVILGYGVLMGIGLGLGYLSPIKSLILWFKNYPGIATGLAIGGFGLSKSLYSPLLAYLLENVGVEHTLQVMAGLGSSCILLAACLLKKPEDWVEKHDNLDWRSINIPDLAKIWLVFFINITCGLAAISCEASLGGLENTAMLLVIAAVFNTLGRLVLPTIPFTSKAWTFGIILFASAIAAFTEAYGCVLVTLCIVNLGYGGMFSTMPLLLKERFGMNNLSTLHGIVLSAWAIAGLVGNTLAEYTLREHGPGTLFLRLGVLYTIAILIICSLKKES